MSAIGILGLHERKPQIVVYSMSVCSTQPLRTSGNWLCLRLSAVQGRNIVSLPLKLDGEHVACATTLRVLKRLEFDSQLLRSGVLAVDKSGSSDETVVFVRGAPSCIEQIMGKDKVPPNYRQVCANFQFAHHRHYYRIGSSGALKLGTASLDFPQLVLPHNATLQTPLHHAEQS